MSIQSEFKKATENAKDAVRAQRILNDETNPDGNSMGGGKIATSAVATIIAAGGTHSEQEKDRKKKLNAVLKLAGDIAKRIAKRIAELDQEIEDLEKDIAKFNKEIRTIEEDVFNEEELAEFDKLPPAERYEEMREAMNKKLASGDVTKEQYDAWFLLNSSRDAAQAALDAKNVQRDQLKTMSRENDQIKVKLEEALENPDVQIDIEATNSRIQAIDHAIEESMRQTSDTRDAQLHIEGAQQGVRIVESKLASDVDTTFANVDEEVEFFMQEFARIQLIPNDLERLSREQELTTGLSEEAIEIVSWEEEAEKLFEDNYFDALENSQIVHSDVKTVAIKPDELSV